MFNLYGKSPESLSNMLLAFSAVLEDCSTEEITAAFRQWMKTQTVMPTPADILKIARPAKPQEPRISGAEFIHAKEQWKLEGFPSYSYYATVVKDYERQNAEDRGAKHDGPVHPQLAARVAKALEDKSGGAA